MTVLTLDGTETITGAAADTFAGTCLYNLSFDESTGNSTFYANGFLVGDHTVQAAMADHTDLAAARAELPEDLRTDFDSHLADIRARRKATSRAS